MGWIIIGLVLVSLVGSMMWMMPSPRQRVQAIFRREAMQKGMQVQINRLEFPRAIGEAEPETQSCVTYSLSRTGNSARPAAVKVTPWRIFKVNGHANRGLPKGWCWARGEDSMGDPALEKLANIIQDLPADVYMLESTPLAVSLCWWEQGREDAVDNVKHVLERVVSELP